jgi:hypothetical protein
LISASETKLGITGSAASSGVNFDAAGTWNVQAALRYLNIKILDPAAGHGITSCLFSQLPNYQAASGQWGKFCVDANNGVVTTV